MNIFALSSNPHDSARMMLDKHVVKMPTETCQMLHTNILYMEYIEKHGKEPTLNELKVFHWHNDSPLMKPAMLNHPSTIWARQSIANFDWLYQHGLALCNEFQLRYNKVHGTQLRINQCDAYQEITMHHNYPLKELTPVAIAMADEYRLDYDEWEQQNPNCNGWDFVIDSYRHYYLEGKWHFADWKTQTPHWWPKNHIVNKHNARILAYNAKGKTQLKLLEEEQ